MTPAKLSETRLLRDDFNPGSVRKNRDAAVGNNQIDLSKTFCFIDMKQELSPPATVLSDIETRAKHRDDIQFWEARVSSRW